MAFDTLLAPDTGRFTREGYWPGRTITDYLDAAAAKDPGKLAVVDPRGRYTYGELKQLADRCALGLLKLGIRPGDVVSFQLPNWIEWLVVHYAVTRIGAVSNPLIPIYRDREVGLMTRLAGSKLLVVAREFRNFDYAQMARHMTDMEVVSTYEGTDTIQSLIVGRDVTGISAFR